MPHACDLDGGLAAVIEEDPVVAAAQTEAGFRRPELLHIAASTGQISVNAVENLDCGFSINAPQIGTGFRRPCDRYAVLRPRSMLETELAQYLIVRDAFSTLERNTGAV